MRELVERIKVKIVPYILIISVKIRNKWDRFRIKNNDFTIFACNCAAGCMYHDLGMRFDSPTIDLYIYPDDYILFLENPQYYFAQKIQFLSDDQKSEPFPVGILGEDSREIKIYFNHYESKDQAEKKWIERSKRVHWDNVYVIMSDQNGCTGETARKFDKLSYNNKVFYSSKLIDDVACLKIIPDNGRGEIKTLTHYINMWGKRYYAYKFDYVAWLNNR